MAASLRRAVTGPRHNGGRAEPRIHCFLDPSTIYLADASLLWLAEAEGLAEITTLDERDFGVYRTTRGAHLRNVLVPKPPRPRRSKAVAGR